MIGRKEVELKWLEVVQAGKGYGTERYIRLLQGYEGVR